MSIDSLKAQLLESKKHVQDLQSKQRELIQRLTDTRENLPLLQRAVAGARLTRQMVSDQVVLNEAKSSDLEASTVTLQEAEKKYADWQALFDALTRQTKVLEGGIPSAIAEAESLKRQLWEAISTEFETKITVEIKDAAKTLFAIGCQIGRPRQLILDGLFPNPTHDEVLEIQRQLRRKHGLD